MINSFLRMLREEHHTLSREEIDHGKAAVEANLAKIREYKRAYMKFGDHKKWAEADEEEAMLKRLLAEYKILAGDLNNDGFLGDN